MAKPKNKPEDITRKTFVAKVKQEGGEGSRRFTFTLSSGTVDRDHDVIEQQGIDVGPFRENPVVLWAHDHGIPPVARVSTTFFRNGNLMGSVEFPPEGTSQLSDTLRGLVENGFLSAVSVGFSPVEWTFDEERGGFDFKRVELMEVSLVPVPSNRDALIEAAAKGIAIEPVVKWAKAVLGREPEENKPAELEELRELRKVVEELKAASPSAEPKIEIPEGYELVKVGDVLRVSPIDSPEPTATESEEDNHQPKPRKVSEAEKKQLASAVRAALGDLARSAVNYHTGRLD